jgi:hypothetical protein
MNNGKTRFPRGVYSICVAELPQERFHPRPREDEQDERNLFDRAKNMFG